jgi:hypothetical protein
MYILSSYICVLIWYVCRSILKSNASNWETPSSYDSTMRLQLRSPSGVNRFRWIWNMLRRCFMLMLTPLINFRIFPGQNHGETSCQWPNRSISSPQTISSKVNPDSRSVAWRIDESHDHDRCCFNLRGSDSLAWICGFIVRAMLSRYCIIAAKSSWCDGAVQCREVSQYTQRLAWRSHCGTGLLKLGTLTT